MVGSSGRDVLGEDSRYILGLMGGRIGEDYSPWFKRRRGVIWICGPHTPTHQQKVLRHSSSLHSTLHHTAPEFMGLGHGNNVGANAGVPSTAGGGHPPWLAVGGRRRVLGCRFLDGRWRLDLQLPLRGCDLGRPSEVQRTGLDLSCFKSSTWIYDPLVSIVYRFG